MKTTDYASPRARIIENYIDKKTCDYIIKYCNDINLWSYHNLKREGFTIEKEWERYERTWKDRSINLDQLYQDNREEHLDFLRFSITLQKKMKAEVKDFFNIEKDIYLENWAAVRWGLPYNNVQGPHIDFIPQNMEKEDMIVEGMDKEYIEQFKEESFDRYKRVFTSKEYTSMLYLNDDFDGGELYFPQHNNFLIRPKPGLLVIFRGDINHFHGIVPVLNGMRHVYTAFWTTQIDKSTQIAKDEYNNKIDERLYDFDRFANI